MRKLCPLAVCLLLAARLEAHDVVWPDNPDGKQPQKPMLLYFPGPEVKIRIKPESGELCTVQVNVPAVNSTLISAAVSGPNPALEVSVAVRALRAPANGSETITISGTWQATGLPQNAGCTAVNPNPFSVTVRVLAAITTAEQLNAVHTGDPVSTATGEMTAAAADLSLGGPLPLQFGRYYASRLNTSSVASALGPNWMHNFDQQLWISGSSATVVLYQGKLVRFQQSGGGWKLDGNEAFSYQMVSTGGTYQFLDLANALIYTFSSTGALTAIQDRNGNALTVMPGPSGPTSVSDGLGRSLAFKYTADQQLASVQDQTGRSVAFTYSGGTLATATDAGGNVTKYTYLSGAQPALLTSMIRPAANVAWTQTYDSSGRVIKQADSFANTTTLAFDQPSRGTQTITDPSGNTSVHLYQGSADLGTLTDAAGQNASFSYDGSSRLTSITDRAGNRSTATYHASSGFIASVTDAQGNSNSYAYAEQAQSAFTFYNLTRITYADGTSISFTYDSTGNVQSVTDAAGKLWSYTYNTRGQMLTASNPAGGVTTLSYNNDGTLATIKNPAGDLTAYSYDEKKRISQVKFADSGLHSFTYDALDHLLSAADERGKMATFAYDVNGNLKSLTDPLSQTAAARFDANERIVEMTDALGKTTAYQYNANGLLASVANAVGEKTSYTYDSLNRVKAMTDSAGNGPSFTYDREGRLASIADALGNSVTLAVDKVGRISRSTTALGENYERTFDAAGRVRSVSNPLSETTTYGWDARGLLTSVGTSGGIAARYTRDDLGLLSGITDPNGNLWTRKHDGSGRLTSDTDPLGRATTYGLDSRNRVNRITTPAGSIQIAYDAAGNRTQFSYSDGTVKSLSYDDDNRPTGGTGVTLGYDAAGRITSSNGLSITRDDAGRIATVTYAPGRTVTYSYDKRGLLAKVSDWTGGSIALAYDAAARRTSMVRANGATTEFEYDKDGRVRTIREKTTRGELATIIMERDAAGKTISASRNTPTAPAPPSATLELTYDAAHQVAGAGYDGLGRITRDNQRTYAWNLASELVSYSGASGASFGYDAFGMRTSRTQGSATQTFVLNYALSLPSIATVKSGGADQRYYVYLPDGELLYSIEAADGSHRYFHFDEAGSTQLLTSDAGTVSDSYGITPYGETVTHSGSTENPFTFQGAFGVMQEASSGLYYMRARYYDSAAARFLSRDPFHSLDPRALNPYQYALANPLTYTDPDGRCALDPKTGVWLPCPTGQPSKTIYGNYVGPGNIGGVPIDDTDYAAWLHDDDYLKLGLGGPLDALFGISGWWADLKLVARALCATNMGFTQESGVGHFFYGWALSKIGIPLVFGTAGILKAGVSAVVTVGEPIVAGVATMPDTVNKAITDLANTPSPGLGPNPVDTVTKVVDDLTSQPNTGSVANPGTTISKALKDLSTNNAPGTPNVKDTFLKALGIK
jgi:RHS repeat-associated protein